MSGEAGPLSSLLQRNLEGSARGRELLASLDGRAIELRLAGTTLAARLRVSEGRLQLQASADDPVDATLTATPLTLARLAQGGGAAALRPGDLVVSGDAHVAQGFQRLLEAARPDWEEELARYVGDLPAHHLARAARGGVGFAARVGETLARNVAEYLTEESRDLAAPTEIEEWIAAVDRLRDDVDRLEARLLRLERLQRA